MKLNHPDFLRLKDFMLQNYGVNLEKKASLIEGRLSILVTQSGFDNFHDYIDHQLTNNPNDFMTLLVSKLTTNFTYFMREKTHYDFMMHHALPEWSERIRDFDLRCWSAGCSSGEEAYTAAMVIDDFFGPRISRWDTTILATDISEKVLALAQKGIYPASHVKGLDPMFIMKYFINLKDGSYQISPEIASRVRFSKFNLMNSFNVFKRKFHIIFCRNVMIYFDAQTRANLINRYYDALEPGGYLFIGLSETMANQETRFEYVMPSIYRRSM